MINQHQYTQGPWSLGQYANGVSKEPSEEELNYCIILDSFNPLAFQNGGYRWQPIASFTGDWPEEKANAVLVSAAPELVQELQNMVKYFQPNPENIDQINAIQTAKSAIRKALGMEREMVTIKFLSDDGTWKIKQHLDPHTYFLPNPERGPDHSENPTTEGK